MENYALQRVLSIKQGEKVTLCIDKRTNQYCVISELPLTGIPESEYQSVLEEQMVFTTLNHPNILRYIDAFITDNTLCTVTDYAQGGSLLTKFEKAGGMLFDESQILDWFAKICIALKYCHDHNVLHRNIQAKNVVFLRNGMLKLKGFVNTKVLMETSNFTTTAKTAPYFLAPEICQGKDYNYKTEVWALGCLLYQLCAQRPPFEANSITILIRKIMKSPITPIPYIFSSNLRTLVSSMLNKHPSKRPNINKILSQDFIRSELHQIMDSTMKQFELEVKNLSASDKKKKKRPTPINSPSGNHSAWKSQKQTASIQKKHSKEMKKEFQALELHSPKKQEKPKSEKAEKTEKTEKKRSREESGDLGTTIRFNMKVDPIPGDEKVDELKERIRKKRDEIREQIFREQHPELFVEEGEECPPPKNPNLSALLHLSSDSDDEQDEFVELAAIAQSIFEAPPKEEEAKDEEKQLGVAETKQLTLNSSFFTGLNENELPMPKEVPQGDDSLTYRIEEIRNHLEKQLGFDAFVKAYEIVKTASDDTSQEDIENKLKTVLTTKEKFLLYPLIQHLCVLEETL